MAEGNPNMCSIDNTNIIRQNLVLNKINKDKDHLYLSYDGKRVKWTSSFESLKKFVEDIIKEPGKWSSPGGTSRKFTSPNSDLSITWYHNKQKTLLFQGKSGDKLKRELIKICEETASNVNIDGHDTSSIESCSDQRDEVTTNTDSTIYPRNGIAMLPTDRVSCNCSCGSMLEEFEDMKLNIEILQTRVDSLQSLANTQEVCPPVDIYLNKINLLEQEISNEKMKTNQLESELNLLKKNFSEQCCVLNNNLTIEENLTAGKIPKDLEEGENLLIDNSCIIIQMGDVNQVNNNNENQFAAQLQEYKEKQRNNFTRFDDQKQRNSNTPINTFERQLNERQNKHMEISARIEKPKIVYSRSNRSNTKVPTWADNSVRKLNDPRGNEYNKNIAHGFDRVSSKHRQNNLISTDNNLRKYNCNNSYLHQPKIFWDQRAHTPKFLQKRTASHRPDWRKHLELVRRVTTSSMHRIVNHHVIPQNILPRPLMEIPTAQPLGCQNCQHHLKN